MPSYTPRPGQTFGEFWYQCPTTQDFRCVPSEQQASPKSLLNVISFRSRGRNCSNQVPEFLVELSAEKLMLDSRVCREQQQQRGHNEW